jgi:DNA polymerase (family 10)
MRARLVPVGSLRRQEPFATDIDLLVVVPDGARGAGDLLASAALRPSPPAQGARATPALEIAGDRRCGPRRRTMLLSGGALHRFPVDLFLVRESELPFALFHYTGSRAYNIRTRAHAKRLGWTLNQYGLFDRAGRRVRGTRQIRTEAEVAARLGLSHRAATDRKK